MENPGVKWGVYLGIAVIAWTLISYIIGPDFMFSTSGWIALVIYIGAMVMAAKETLENQGGFAAFGDVFKASWITFAIGVLVGTIFSYILTNFVDPGLLDAQKEMTIEATRKTMEAFGAGEDAVEQALEAVEDDNSASSPLKILMGYGISLVIPGAILAAIIGAIMKKPNPEAI